MARIVSKSAASLAVLRRSVAHNKQLCALQALLADGLDPTRPRLAQSVKEALASFPPILGSGIRSRKPRTDRVTKSAKSSG